MELAWLYIIPLSKPYKIKQKIIGLVIVVNLYIYREKSWVMLLGSIRRNIEACNSSLDSHQSECLFSTRVYKPHENVNSD